MHFGRFGHKSFGFDGAGGRTGGRAVMLLCIVHPAFWLLSLLACAVFLTAAEPAFAAASGKRLALVIGNSAYKSENVPRLPNASGDADAVGGKLESLGFEVIRGLDVDRERFERLLLNFRDKINAANAQDVVFYYAGHGFQLDGYNHLVPIDAKLTKKSRVPYETVQLDDVIRQINANPAKQKTIVFLDACRDNPLPESQRGDEPANGLAQLQSGSDADGVFVVFSTRPGEVSQDGKGVNSPFAEALLRHIATPDVSISDMMTDVASDVYEATNARQTPWLQASLRSKFYFNPKRSLALSDPTDEQTANANAADSDNEQPKPPRVPSVRLSPDEDEPSNPAPVAPPQSGELANKPPELDTTTEPASPVPETPAQSDVVAGTPPDLPARDVPPASAPATNAPVVPNMTKPEAPVEVATVPQQSQPDNPPAVEVQPATPPLPEEKKMVSLEPKQTAQELASSSGRAIDPAPDRGIAVIRPSTANSASDVPAAGKPLKIVQRASDGLALRPSGERFEDEEKKVAVLTSPTENVEPPGIEPDKQDQPSLPQQVQAALSSVGCFAGAIDGKWGRDSDAALARYLKEKGSGDPAAGPTEEVLASLERETGKVCPPKLEQPEPPATVKKSGGVKKPATVRKPPPAAKPPVVKTPRVVRTPPVVKVPKVVRTPPAVKTPKVVKAPPKPPKVASQQPKKIKPPPENIVIPKIGGFVR